MKMEFCNRYSLNELLNLGKFPLSKFNLLIEHILKGLVYLHDNNLVHSDLKLSNVLINYENDNYRFMLGDLSSLKKNNERFLIKGGYITPEIISPECYFSGVINYKSDVWSLGVLIYLLLTGSYPFGDRRFLKIKEIKNNILNSKIIGCPLTDILYPWNVIVEGCLQYEIDKRFSSRELLNFFHS